MKDFFANLSPPRLALAFALTACGGDTSAHDSLGRGAEAGPVDPGGDARVEEVGDDAWTTADAGAGGDGLGGRSGGGSGGTGGDAGQGGSTIPEPFGQPLEFSCTPEPTEPRSVTLPKDEAPHETYFEWWYWTGHLLADDGSRFGFQLTFFQAFPDLMGISGTMGHFAVSDPGAGAYAHDYKFAPLGAYARRSEGFDLEIGGWTASSIDDSHRLAAAMTGYSLQLDLEDTKQPALHFDDGYLAYPAPYQDGNYYYSRTRMRADGTITVGGIARHVTGLAWMDQQWGRPPMDGSLPVSDYRWEWYQMQLQTGEDLMLFVLYLGAQPWISGGTYVGINCSAESVGEDDFTVTALGSWESPHTQKTYPAGWEILVPGRSLALTALPTLADQEFYKHGSDLIIGAIVPPSYWEGAVDITGSGPQGPVQGLGFVEVTP